MLDEVAKSIRKGPLITGSHESARHAVVNDVQHPAHRGHHSRETVGHRLEQAYRHRLVIRWKAEDRAPVKKFLLLQSTHPAEVFARILKTEFANELEMALDVAVAAEIGLCGQSTLFEQSHRANDDVRVLVVIEMPEEKHGTAPLRERRGMADDAVRNADGPNRRGNVVPDIAFHLGREDDDAVARLKRVPNPLPTGLIGALLPQDPEQPVMNMENGGHASVDSGTDEQALSVIAVPAAHVDVDEVESPGEQQGSKQGTAAHGQFSNLAAVYRAVKISNIGFSEHCGVEPSVHDGGDAPLRLPAGADHEDPGTIDAHARAPP